MVQPYDGVRLAAVHDLPRDPDEEHHLLGAPVLELQTVLFRRSIEGIRMSQAVLHAGRIWPAATATSGLSGQTP